MPEFASPVRVALCITELNPGGAERAFVQLALGMSRADWTPSVYCIGPRGALAEELEREGVPVACYGASGVRHLPRVLRRLTTDLRAFRPAILQTWLYHANLAGRIAGHRAGVPIVVSGIRVAERRSRWRLRFDRWTSGWVNRHVCVSQAVADFSIREGGLPADRVVVIPNGVDVERFSTAPPVGPESLGVPPQSPTVLFAGRLDPQKDPLLFVEMAARVARLRPEARFLIAGDGPLRSAVARQVEMQGLTETVRLLGRRADVASLMRSAACLALCSRWEGMPNVVLEAMAAGIPVVATDVEGVRELVLPNQTGLIVPPNNVEELTAAVLLVLSDPESATALGRCAQDIACERFTWFRFISSHVDLYRALLVENSPSSPSLPS